MGIFKNMFKLTPTWDEPTEPKSLEPRWITIAKKEIGTKEKRGGENPRIIEYHATTVLKATEDEQSWCSSFVNWCFKKSAIKGTNSAAARSWLNWGVTLAEPKPGCVVVFWRESRTSWKGHVAFLDRIEGDRIYVLGGNQSDAVNVSSYPLEQVLGYRWPA